MARGAVGAGGGAAGRRVEAASIPAAHKRTARANEVESAPVGLARWKDASPLCSASNKSSEKRRAAVCSTPGGGWG